MSKRIIISVVVVLMSIGSIFSQAQLKSSARVFSNILKENAQHGNNQISSDLVRDYDLVLINGEYHIGVLSIVSESQIDKNQLRLLNIVNDTRLQNLWSFRVPIRNFDSFINLKGIEFIEIGEPVSPLLEYALPSARVDSVHLGLGGLMRPYKGKGVVVAIIDWGFDYTHPTFYDTTLTNLRLIRAWDQNKLSGPHPTGYSFGTEYIGQDELLAAGSDTLYVFGPGSHGTHVGGIAGGTGAGTVHRGVAYESELIFISLRRDAPSLIDAFSYITNYAASVNKPYVVNMSFGSHLGPHDGTSLKNLGIDILHGPGKVFVGSAGNNGTSSANFHLDKNFADNPNDTLVTVVGFTNTADMFGQTLSMWGSANSDFEVALRLVNNSDSTIHQTVFYKSNQEPTLIDTLVFGNDSLIIRIQSTASHFLNNKPNIRLEVKKTGPTKVVLLATSANSHLHIWNNVRLNPRYTNWGVPLQSNYPGAIAGNNNYGLGEPGGVGKNVITVGSYRAERVLGNGTEVHGRISSFSSYGPTVDNRTKPDISSTGEAVISSVNSFNLTETNYQTTVDFNGTTYGFISYSGTSMSGPTVAGIVALMLDAFPKMSATQVKEVLKATARLDQYTGEIDENGHLQWGWGKANALAAILSAEMYSSVENLTIQNDGYKIYPNPASEMVNAVSENNAQIKRIEIYCLQGKLIKTTQNIQSNSIQVNINDLDAGIYLIKIESDVNFAIKRLVVSR